MPVSFRDHLTRQLAFLRRSCEAYDAGHLDEAIRIATMIRVLIHNTKSSTSLLQHLGEMTINLLTTTEDPPRNTLFSMGLGVQTATIQTGSVSATYVPLFDGPISSFIPVERWWGQVVYVLNLDTRLTRRELVLAAANKDGGAHVDARLTSEYEALSQEGAMGALVYCRDGELNRQSFTNAHLVGIRQLGYELLHSPELFALAEAA